MKIIIAILIFSILILFHELGHFLLAKKNGIIVDEFSLGLGPRIVSTVRGETRYSLKVLPFGGSCMMHGEDEDEDGEGSFNAAPIWARISAIAAGPIFNFILAFFIALILVGTLGYDPARVKEVIKDSPVEAAGLQEGDVITHFNDVKIDVGRDLYNYEKLQGLSGDPITIKFLRDGEKKFLTYDPEDVDKYMLGYSYSPTDSGEAQVTSVNIDSPFANAGIQPGDTITAMNDKAMKTADDLTKYLEQEPLSGKSVEVTYKRDGKEEQVQVTPQKTTYVETGFYYNTKREKTGPLGVIKYSFMELKYWVRTTVQSLKMLIKGKVGINDLSGPVGVVDVIGDAYEESKTQGALVTWMNIFNMMILLSVNLGIMNLLPLPALDGGRLIFLMIEAIRGKAINRQVEGVIHFAGLMILMALIIYVTFHDIIRIF